MFDVIQATLRRINELCPSMRYFQILSNAVPSEVAQRLNNDFYYVEDKDLMVYLFEYEAKLRSRHTMSVCAGCGKSSSICQGECGQ